MFKLHVSNGHSLDVGHQVVGDAIGVLANQACNGKGDTEYRSSVALYDMDAVPASSILLRVVVAAKNIQLWPLSSGHLLDAGHQVVGVVPNQKPWQSSILSKIFATASMAGLSICTA